MAIQTLNLNFEAATNSTDAPKGFWKRQFGESSTPTQKTFDWAFGVILPLICIAADPIVFRHDGDLLATYRPFAYVLSLASILAMAAWLSWGSRLRWLAAPLSGLFFVGGSVSLLVGIILLPFSIVGIMFFFIGLLGFTPIFSAVVFLRNGRRAYKASMMTLEDPAAWQAAFLAGLFCFVIPYVVNVQIAQAVNHIASGDVNTIRRETAKLKLVAPLADLTPISKQYGRFEVFETESPRAKELAHAYNELSGLEIENAPYGWD